MATEQRRKNERVIFQKGFDAHMLAIDGTWRRACTLQDVSEEGARLILGSTIEGLHLKEFFPPAFIEWLGLPPLRTSLDQR